MKSNIEICYGQNGKGTIFYSSTQNVLVNVIPSKLLTYTLYMTVAIKAQLQKSSTKQFAGCQAVALQYKW